MKISVIGAGYLGTVHAATLAAIGHEVIGLDTAARHRVAEIAVRLLGGSVKGRAITVLGASFRSHTDDIRDSPTPDVACQLANQGANVSVSDPRALETAWLQYRQLTFESQLETVLEGVGRATVAGETDSGNAPRPHAVL